MKRWRFISATAALVVGTTILVVSLATTNNKVLSAGTNLGASQRKLYFDDTVLPDHALYPVLMVVDRAQLELAPQPERVYMLISYGQRRMGYANELWHKDKPELALTTVERAHHYFLQAAEEVKNPETADNHTLHNFVHKSLVFYGAQLEETKAKADDQGRAKTDTLIDQLDAVVVTFAN